MERAEIKERITRIVRDHFRVSPTANLKDNFDLLTDFGATTWDRRNIFRRIADEFCINPLDTNIRRLEEITDAVEQELEKCPI